jgi:hypothetical protein
MLEQDLFEIRDKIMDLTRKFDKGSKPSIDLDKKSGKQAWKG